MNYITEAEKFIKENVPNLKQNNSECNIARAFAYHLQVLDKELKCSKCNAPFLNHEHHHRTKDGIFHTSCYKKSPDKEEEEHKTELEIQTKEWKIIEKINKLIDYLNTHG